MNRFVTKHVWEQEDGSLEPECPRCGEETSGLTFVHDWRCWGLRLAIWNLWALLTWPSDRFKSVGE